MYRPRIPGLAAALLVAALLAGGCGGGDGDGGDVEAADASSEPAQDDSSDDDEAVADDDEPEEEASDGQVLIEDGFDAIDDHEWNPDVLDYPGQDATIADGAFRVEVTEDQYAELAEGAVLGDNLMWPSELDGAIDELADTRVEATVELEAAGTVGLTCRQADAEGLGVDYSVYSFILSSTGVAALWETEDDGVSNAFVALPESDPDEPADEFPVEGSVYEFGAGVPLDLAFECVDGDDGVELTGWIDGEEVLTTVDEEDPIESGVAGFAFNQSPSLTQAGLFEPFEVSVDTITITNLGDEIDESLLEGRDAESAEPVNGLLVGAAFQPDLAVEEYGTDPTFDGLADSCFEGAFEDCDQLYRDTPVGGGYERYGSTCGERLATGVTGRCVELAAFAELPSVHPEEAIADFGTDDAFDNLAITCYDGGLDACDELYRQTPVDSSYEAYGATCGERRTGTTGSGSLCGENPTG